jgi:hypothetical protein
MNRGLANMVDYEGVRFSILKECLDHEGIASQNGLVESEFAARVDLRFSLLEDHLQNAVVIVV